MLLTLLCQNMYDTLIDLKNQAIKKQRSNDETIMTMTIMLCCDDSNLIIQLFKFH